MRAVGQSLSITALICFGFSLAPLGLLSLASLGTPPSEWLTPFWATSAGFAAIGLLFASLARFKAREKTAGPILILLCVPLLLSGWGLKESLEARALSRAQAFCGQARRDGAAPIPQTDPRYKKSLDRDGDGLGCERQGAI